MNPLKKRKLNILSQKWQILELNIFKIRVIKLIYKKSRIKFYFPERGDTHPMKNNIGHSKLITTRHFVSATAWHEAQSPVGLKVKNEYFLKVIELINRSIFYVPFSDSKWAHHQYLRQKACVRMTNILKSKKLINDNLIRQVMASKRSPLINVPSGTNLVIAPPPDKKPCNHFPLWRKS